VWRLEVCARLRRVACPHHGVRVEGVPFARHRSGFTHDFEGLVAWLATRTDKTTIKRMVRIDWDSVGRISMDMGPGYAKSARAGDHAPQATICIDSFHVVQLATRALDEVRRDY
jgi:transposase